VRRDQNKIKGEGGMRRVTCVNLNERADGLNEWEKVVVAVVKSRIVMRR